MRILCRLDDARSSEVDDENDGWEEWERARVGFRGGVTDDR